MTEAWALAAGAAASCAAAGAVWASAPPLIRWLSSRGSCVPDRHRRGGPPVPRPGGPALAAGLAAGLAVLYAFVQEGWVLAVLAAALASFAAGLADDRWVLGGWFKPLALAAAAAPVLLLGAYDTDLYFPPFGDVRVPVLYIAVAVAAVVLAGNAVNSIDIYNGLASAFVAVAAGALALSLAIMGSPGHAAAAAALAAASAAFYRFHRAPSRVFPGDSGALALGGAYGALAVAAGAEVVAAVALLPAAVNSFLFLSSTRRIVEHRELGAGAVRLRPDGLLEASDDPRAPVTLARLLLAIAGPRTEARMVLSILKLALLSAGMAVATALMAVAAR